MATATKRKVKTKKPTPLSTRSLAAYLTWKQFDILLLLGVEGVCTTRYLSDQLTEIKAYDIKHGGAFYAGVDYGATHGSLRTMMNRRLIDRIETSKTGYVEWSITPRGRKALRWLENDMERNTS
jgi:DNA-binding MarR family transcriptional regulator